MQPIPALGVGVPGATAQPNVEEVSVSETDCVEPTTVILSARVATRRTVFQSQHCKASDRISR